MTFEFTEAMNEVSGLGGYYERCCRAAVAAGAKWCAENPQTFDPEAVERAIREAPITTDDGRKVKLDDELTSAQFGVAMHHVRYIAKQGWDEYCTQMSVPVVVYDEDEFNEPEHE
jgi:hypothetical protein